MGFNWKGALRAGITDVSNRYNAALEEQQEFERQEKMMNVKMMKEKEMSSWKTKEAQKAEQFAYDKGVTREADQWDIEQGREADKYNTDQERKIAERTEQEAHEAGKRPGQLQGQIADAKTKSKANTQMEIEAAKDKIRAALGPDATEEDVQAELKKSMIKSGKAKGLDAKELAKIAKDAKESVSAETEMWEDEDYLNYFGGKPPEGNMKKIAKKEMENEYIADIMNTVSPQQRTAPTAAQMEESFNPDQDLPKLMAMKPEDRAKRLEMIKRTSPELYAKIDKNWPEVTAIAPTTETETNVPYTAPQLNAGQQKVKRDDKYANWGNI